jgi:hypothetical protein
MSLPRGILLPMRRSMENCACDHWNNQLLLNDAERRVVNEFGERAAAANPVVHAQRVQEMAADLRVRHDCYDHRWQHRQGGGECEECGDFLPTFLKVCPSADFCNAICVILNWGFSKEMQTLSVTGVLTLHS